MAQDKKAPDAIVEKQAKPSGTTAKNTKPTVSSGAAQAFLKRVQPHHIVWNPNDKENRPVVALTLAVMSNSILDYTLESNHKAPAVALGLPNGAGTVQGDFAIARYIARHARNATLYETSNASTAAVIDMWIDYAISLTRLNGNCRFQAAVLTVEKALRAGRTFLTGHAITLADVALFQVFGFPTTDSLQAQVTEKLPDEAVETKRWIKTLAVHPALQEATQLCASGNEVHDFVGLPVLEPLVPGMNALEGALPGMVVTRFPPEPSGYL